MKNVEATTFGATIDVKGKAALRNSGPDPEIFNFSIVSSDDLTGKDRNTARLVIMNECVTMFDEVIRAENLSAAVRIAMWTIDTMLYMDTNPEYN
jgi:hypothetical protein